MIYLYDSYIVTDKTSLLSAETMKQMQLGWMLILFSQAAIVDFCDPKNLLILEEFG